MLLDFYTATEVAHKREKERLNPRKLEMGLHRVGKGREPGIFRIANGSKRQNLRRGKVLRLPLFRNSTAKFTEEEKA